MIVKYGEPVIISPTINSLVVISSLHQTDICVYILKGVRAIDQKISMRLLYFDLCCGVV